MKFNFLSIMLLAGAMVIMPTQARNKKTNTPKTAAPQVAATTQRGLFNVTKAGQDWFFTIPDSLLNREMLATVRFTSTPANTGKYGGELVAEQTVYFQKSPDGKLLMRSRLLVNKADSVDNINRAIIVSNEEDRKSVV